MLWLVLGLALFIAAHSVRIVADDWRARTLARVGPGGWKAMVSAASVAGLALIVVGYGQTRIDPIWLWLPPLWTRHLAALLTLVAFVLVAAAYVPGNHLKAAVGHPMVLGVKVWAFAHLLANGTLADALLFGGLLAWAIASFAAARRRDRRSAAPRPPVAMTGTAITVVAGVLAWAAVAFWLHLALFGIAPFGRA